MPHPPDQHLHPHPKPNPNLLSIFLKPIIMLLLTSIFFLFLGFAAFLLLNLFLLGGALHRLRFRASHIRTQSSSDGFLPSDINKLPHFRISRGSAPGSDSHCAVCLDGFRNGQWCRKLAACGHIFHRRCVDMWIVKVATCPTCRTPVRLNTGGGGGAPNYLPTTIEGTSHSPQFWTCSTSTNTNSFTLV